MSGTPRIATVILNRLSGDGTFSGLLPGGVYDRPLKREGDGETPNAFAPTFPYQPRPAAVVVDGSDETDAFGPDGSFMSFPWVYFYAAPTQSGKDTIANAWDVAFSALHNYRFATGNGTGAQIKVRALVTERVGVDHAFIPFHFSGWWQGKDLLDYYPEGAHPIVRGEAVNTATTYGYDSVTMMQETKTTVCQIERFA